MKIMFFNILVSISLLACSGLYGQSDGKKARAAVLLNVSFGGQIPGGDLANRFGNNLFVGGGAGFKTRTNWILSWEAQFVFGSVVRNESAILANSLTDNLQILNTNGSYATIDLFQRGTYSTFNAEKILNFWNATANSGPVIGLGAGYNVSWMYLDNAGDAAPQFAGEKSKGYDQLSMGLMLKQSVGYFHLSPNRRINFKIALEFGQAFTEQVRDINFYEGTITDTQQLDLFYGLRLDWFFPIYQLRKQESEYYYD